MLTKVAFLAALQQPLSRVEQIVPRKKLQCIGMQQDSCHHQLCPPETAFESIEASLPRNRKQEKSSCKALNARSVERGVKPSSSLDQRARAMQTVSASYQEVDRASENAGEHELEGQRHQALGNEKG